MGSPRLRGNTAELCKPFLEDRALQESIRKETDRKLCKKGIDDPKFRLIHFHTKEATF